MTTMTAVLKEDVMTNEASQAAQILRTHRCPRCNGLMISEWSDDLSDYAGRRCVQCGELIDPVILHNRWLQQAEALRPDDK